MDEVIIKLSLFITLITFVLINVLVAYISWLQMRLFQDIKQTAKADIRSVKGFWKRHQWLKENMPLLNEKQSSMYLKYKYIRLVNYILTAVMLFSVMLHLVLNSLYPS